MKKAFFDWLIRVWRTFMLYVSKALTKRVLLWYRKIKRSLMIDSDPTQLESNSSSVETEIINKEDNNDEQEK